MTTSYQMATISISHIYEELKEQDRRWKSGNIVYFGFVALLLLPAASVIFLAGMDR